MRLPLPPATFALASLCGALALLLAYEILMPLADYTLPEVAARKISDVILPPAKASLPPSESFAAIGERPLFSANRKPAQHPETASTEPAGPPPLPNANLVGIIIDGTRRLALLRLPSIPLAQSFGVGDGLESWKITAIEADHVVLRAGTFEQRLDLNANRPNAPAQPMAQVSQPTEIPQTNMSP